MDFEVLIAGAGPAGCLAARELARRGFRVGLFDPGTREDLGKPIIVEVDLDFFSRAGVSPPSEPEIPYHPRCTRIFSARGREAFRFTGRHPPALWLDRFARRLLGEAERAGARFFGGYRARETVRKGNRVSGAILDHQGRREEVRARLVIDATGFEASLVRTLDPEAGIPFRDDPRDCVLAANYLHGIDAVQAAEAVREGRQQTEETWVWLGTSGSYSTLFSHLSLSRNRAYLLAGQKADFAGPPVGEAVQAFQQRQGYFRERISGGTGRIRISRPLDRLAADGFLAIGEAASLVIPINGSGVGTALLSADLAARVSARALRDGEPTTASLWSFAAGFMRSQGADLAACDAIRLVTESMSSDQFAAMLEGGLSGSDDIRNLNRGQPFSFSPFSLPRRLRAMAKNPGLIAPLGRMGASALQVRALYRKYPETYDPATLAAWREKARRLFPRRG